MDRREPWVRNLPFMAGPYPSPGETHPVSSEISPLLAEERLSFRNERSNPRPDSSTRRRIKKFHTGLTE